jgi:6-phosphogluconolactonase/glucosamine-6-phosphate isomerase/deaminase
MHCEDGAASYQLTVGDLGFFDVVHLGMGADGHTASLFPNTAALDAEPGQLVAMNSDPSGNNPHPRMTLTYSGIARSRLVIFTVAGAAKATAMRAVYEGADLPAARVTSEQVTWVVSRDAAPL